MRRLAIAAAVVAIVAAVVGAVVLVGTQGVGRQQRARDDRAGDDPDACPETASADAAGHGPPDLGSRSDPHVPRRRRPSRRGSLPRALRLARGLRGPDRLARPARLPRRDAARRPVALAAGHAPAAASRGRQLRRRLPQPGGDRSADPRAPRLARCDQPHRQEHDGLLGAAARPGATADGGRLGGGLSFGDPSRPEEDRRRGAASERWAARGRRCRSCSTSPSSSSVTPRRLDDRVVAAVRAAGYSGATTTALGVAQPADMFRLARVRVDRSDGVDGLVAKLRSLGAVSAG